MDTARALEHVNATIGLIDAWRATAAKFDDFPYGDETKARKLREKLAKQTDEVQQELVVSRAIASGVGREPLRRNLRSLDQPFADRWHAARECLVELQGSLAKAEEIASIVGPAGPRLAASELHPVIWDAVRNLWDQGEHGPALHVASVALEAHLQGTLDKRDVSGSDLAIAFALEAPSEKWPRLRIRELIEGSETYESAHRGAGHLVRGAFGYVRNLASHPGGFDDMAEAEALEQLAVLSTVARIVDRSDVVTAADDQVAAAEGSDG
ncbi:MAG: TIGR02391 family protein [Microthrixaceae bacterium]